MNETMLRDLLDRATHAEPPMGPLARNSLRGGIRRRRRRRTAAIATTAAAAVLAGGVPALSGVLAGKDHATAHQAVNPAAYVVLSHSVVPLNLATGHAERSITFPKSGSYLGAAITPNGSTLYVVGQKGYVTPIDTATSKAGEPIWIPESIVHTGGREISRLEFGIVIAASGQTAYVRTDTELIPVNLSTGVALKPIDVRNNGLLAVTANGRTAYVCGTPVTTSAGTHQTVIPVNLVTGKALTPIPLRATGTISGIYLTPNSKTAYVAATRITEPGGSNYPASITPIRTATNTALKPIRLTGFGSNGIVFTPDSRAAFALDSNSVTPIDIATNTAQKPISLRTPKSGFGYAIAISPDGGTVYALAAAEHTVVPIDTATDTALKPITRGIPPSFVLEVNGIAASPDGDTVYVTGSSDSAGHGFPGIGTWSVTPIRTATGKVARTITGAGVVREMLLKP